MICTASERKKKLLVCVLLRKEHFLFSISFTLFCSIHQLSINIIQISKRNESNIHQCEEVNPLCWFVLCLVDKMWWLNGIDYCLYSGGVCIRCYYGMIGVQISWELEKNFGLLNLDFVNWWWVNMHFINSLYIH